MNLTRGVTAMTLITCVALCGCQHTSSVPTEGTTVGVAAGDAPVVQPVRSRAPTFAYAVGKFEPQLSLQPGYANAVGRGAAQGLVACGQVLHGGGFGSSFLALIQLGLFAVCAPFGTVGGAIGGAGLRAGQSDTTQVATSVSREHKMSAVLATHLETYARGLGLVDLRELANQGPSSLGDEPRYRSDTDYVIELVLTRIRAEELGDPRKPHGLDIEARGRLIRTSDGATVDSFSPIFGTERMTTDQWMANPGRISEALTKGLAALAQTFVDEFVFIYRGYADAEPLSAAAGNFSPYVLRPLDWPDEKSDTSFLRSLPSVVDVDPGDLTLRWEEVPRSLAGSVSGHTPAVRNVVYDVRLFRVWLPDDPQLRSARSTYLIRPERSFDGLTEPSVRVNPPLERCGLYTWTVRARFEIYGDARVTDWSWVPGERGEGNPRSMRRKLVGDPNATSFSYPSPHFFHYWFAARPAGSPCYSLPTGIPRRAQQSSITR